MTYASDISDIYIPIDAPEESRAFCEGRVLKAQNEESVLSLAQELLANCNKLEMEVGTDKYLISGGEQYRVHFESRKATNQYCLRRMPPFRPLLLGENPEGITFPPLFASLVEKYLPKRGGLYLIAGPLGVGKTTASAALLGHILTRCGGVGWTLEDPPEYDLEGDFGENGICYQHQVQNGDFASSIRSMMRSFPASAPATLFVGEVRDSETVRQVIQSLLNGATVIFTFHAGSPEEAITRLLAMSEGSEYARQILAEALRLVVSLRKLPSLNSKVRVEFEFLEGTMNLAAAIRTDKLSAIKDILIQQKNERNNSLALEQLRR